MVHLPPSPPPAKRLSQKLPKMYSSPSLMPPPFTIPGARALQDLLPPTPHSSDVTPGTVQTRTSWDSFFHPLLSRLDWGLSSARPALPRLHASSNSASRPSRPWAGSLTPSTRVASFLRPVPLHFQLHTPFPHHLALERCPLHLPQSLAPISGLPLWGLRPSSPSETTHPTCPLSTSHSSGRPVSSPLTVFPDPAVWQMGNPALCGQVLRDHGLDKFWPLLLGEMAIAVSPCRLDPV